ncbi:MULTISPECIES: adenylyltransferase/cytidyltransferase family protein [Pseudomonas]|uniref:adenylyltransferase/cytidyltransferase family protein n=1 Tax=Pseudomonas TaxID=286 RepID=UPI00301CBC40
MKTVLTYGTFDLFHVGHLRLLQRLRALGDRLIVGVSTDEFNASKGKQCVIPFEHRCEVVRNLKQVDLVIPESCWSQKLDDICRYKVDVFGMGADWQGKFDDLGEYCEVIYLERTQDISTTHLKNVLADLRSDNIARLKDALDVLQTVAREFR